MVQEEKELLLKDLCARLPYGVQVFVESDKYAPATLLGVDVKRFSIIFGGNNWSSMSKIEGNHVEQHKQLIKPYLRPMSSMTKEEEEEQDKIVIQSFSCSLENSESATTMLHDWLLSKHFDVRGLNNKNLALEAPEGMYNIK